jgi:acetolactate synthase-1/2/3 large subunit
MASALPGAIAASMIFPDRRILAIAGDGGFLMNVQEMETAVRLGVEPVVMVWEDGGYGLIAWKQEDEFNRHTALSFNNPDWSALAAAFGWNGFAVTNSADLARTIETAFTTPGPSLVVLPIDYRENRLLSKRLGELTGPGVTG